MFRRKADGNWISEYENIKKFGHKIIHLDEEGAVFWGSEEEWRRRLSHRMDVSRISYEDSIYTWGQFQKEYYHNSTKSKNILVTGHPRFSFSIGNYSDIYKQETSFLKKKYGDFLLITTSYQWSNNAFGIKDSFSKRVGYDSENTKSLIRHTKYWTHSAKMCAEFVKLTIELSTKISSKKNIVLRPHPSEDLEIYMAAFRDIKNIYIDRSFSIMPWLLCCECLISEGCTTTIEAYLLNKKVCIYQPFKQMDMEMFLPSLMGKKCSDSEEVLDFISDNKNFSKPKLIKNKKALDLMINLTNIDSFELVKDCIMKQYKESKFKLDDHTHNFSKSIILVAFKEHFLELIKDNIRKLFPKKNKLHKAYSSAFDSFDKENINFKVRTIEKLIGKSLRVNYLGKKLLSIELNDD